MTARVDQRILKELKGQISFVPKHCLQVGQRYMYWMSVTIVLHGQTTFLFFFGLMPAYRKMDKSSLATRDYSQSHTNDMHVMCYVV